MIGLLTPHKPVNYGSRLQAYAVQTIFAKYDEVEIIEYFPSIFERGRRRVTRTFLGLEKYNDVKILDGTKSDDPDNIRIRKAAINRFNDHYRLSAPIRTRSELRKKAASYSSVICGSDQVWNPVSMPEHVYLLEFVPDNVRKISIAASFGVPEIPDNLKSYYKKYLRRFSSVSVREEAACKMLEKLGISDVFWSLDPTLITGQDIWHALADEGKSIVPDKPYVFCYFLGNHQLGRKIARRIAENVSRTEKEDCYIVNLPHFKQYVEADASFADFKLYDVGIQEFLSLIRGAKAVITDSFHGTAFSIIFSRNVFCTPRHMNSDSGNTNNRITSLLSFLNIKDRMITKEDEIQPAMDTAIDYEQTCLRLENKRLDCIEFIERSLEVH